MNEPPRQRAPLTAPDDHAEDGPAPVVSEQGTYGTLPPAYDAYDDFEEPSSPRGVGLTLALLGFVVATAVWLGALSVAQATSPQVALPALERGVSVLTDVEALLTLHLEEMRAEAESAGSAGARIELPGYPFAGADFSPDEVTGLDEAELRTLALDRGARRVYEDGVDAFRIEGAEPRDTGFFSTAGGARRVMQFLSASNHDRASMLVWPAGIAAIVLGAVTVMLSRGFRRPLVLGAGLIVASVPVFLLGGVLMVAVMAAGSDGSAVAEEFSHIAETAAWTPIRQATVVALAGLALLVPAWLLRAIFDRSERRTATRARVYDDWQ